MKETCSLTYSWRRTKILAAFVSLWIISLSWNNCILAQPCIAFLKPEPWIPVTTPSCTLSLSSCPEVSSVKFSAMYIPKDDSLSRIVPIGLLTRAPYKLIWNIDTIPNQLTFGFACYAEAEKTDGTTETVKLEGIFLTHHQTAPPSYELPYIANKPFESRHRPMTLRSPQNPSSADVWICWNEKAVYFHIEVKNQFFYTTLPEPILDRIGIKISIDPGNKRNPYLSENILIFMIPASGHPYQVKTKPQYLPDGSFDVQEKRDSCTAFCKVINENFKGYNIDFAIMQKMLGNATPQTISCNIVATVLDEYDEVKRLSWVQGNDYTVFSPFSYGLLVMQDKPLLANLALLWSVSFSVGILLGIVLLTLFRFGRRLNPVIRFENSEMETKIIKLIATIIDAEITNKNFTINDIASKVSISPAKVDKLIKRNYGKNFKKYILFSRIEIVKERLRSSNASEISIAKSCGFTSVDEMEKVFHSFTGTTPYRFREENKIA